MNAKPEDVKSYAVSRLMAGDSYRQVQKTILDTFGEPVAIGTLSAWAHEDSVTAGDISRAHLTTVANQRVRIAVKAADMLEEAIDNGTIPPGQRAITYGIGSDKLDSLLKIVADERNATNDRIMAIRMQLRQKSPAELKAINLHPEDGESNAPLDVLPAEPASQLVIRRYLGLDVHVSN